MKRYDSWNTVNHTDSRIFMNNKYYTPPIVEIVEIAVEVGFSTSDEHNKNGGGIGLPEWGTI